MTLAAGSKLSHYEIIATKGMGGMGEVWKARDTRLGRIVAIKKVKEQHSERFKQEAIISLTEQLGTHLLDIGARELATKFGPVL
jgi:serine/threonine protein kinase